MAQSSDFEKIKQTNLYGIEYWSARDLMPLLGYKRWDRFANAIDDAKQALIEAKQSVQDHIAASGNIVSLGSGAERKLEDFTRSAAIS